MVLRNCHTYQLFPNLVLNLNELVAFASFVFHHVLGEPSRDQIDVRLNIILLRAKLDSSEIHGILVSVYIYIPYSAYISRVFNFANFANLESFAKLFQRKFWHVNNSGRGILSSAFTK